MDGSLFNGAYDKYYTALEALAILYTKLVPRAWSIVYGEDGLFWVVPVSDADILAKHGYQLIAVEPEDGAGLHGVSYIPWR